MQLIKCYVILENFPHLILKKAHCLYDKKEKTIIADPPWIFRTYGGHTNAKETNQLFKTNLSNGQTGLSIAFDLPTQCGYSSDHPIALPEVGKVGVPINSLMDMDILFDKISMDNMNTSMTINGTAMWLMSLYIALAEKKNIPVALLRGTTQNDISKEYLARGTYIFEPQTSFNLIVDMYEYCLLNMPHWNPSNICSYHLQEAGATPNQELSFSLATAIQTLDLIIERGCFSEEEFEQCVGRISFFVNSGLHFVEEMCKMRAFVDLWDEITKTRYKVKNPKYRRFRYGVQVNSLGLTEEQPENNVWRILIEALGVTLSRNARCRALQLPTWNEALSLPRPWDQQWSLRMQQILAYETDILDYPDIFDGSYVIESKVNELKKNANQEIKRIIDAGGVIPSIINGTMKSALVKSQSDRMARIMSGESVVVGRNLYQDSLPSPMLEGNDQGIFKINNKEIKETLLLLEKTYKVRDNNRVEKSLQALEKAARNKDNLVPYSIECARSLATTGEWTKTLKKVFGEYRPPTGIEGQKIHLKDSTKLIELQKRVNAFKETYGYRPRFLIAKPGLDGHSNGAEMVAVAAKHCGFNVIYAGIRLSCEEIIQSTIEENANILALSILSGSHKEITEQIIKELKNYNAFNNIPVILGGIIPESDFSFLKKLGIVAIYTPKDYDLIQVMSSNLDIIEKYASK